MNARDTSPHEEADDGATESELAFAVAEHGAPPTVEIHVNFGLHTGREVTPAEIDRLAAVLLERVERVTIIAEVRHEIDAHSEASVHLVRIATEPADPALSGEVEAWVVARASEWARRCGAERGAEGAPLSEP